MDEPHSIVNVIRVTRPDTLLVRAYCPVLRARGEFSIVVAGVWTYDNATSHIVDWCEVHADAGRLRLVAMDYLRDEYGRMVADLADVNSGETLSGYLMSVGAARSRPHHLLETMGSLMASQEPDHAGG